MQVALITHLLSLDAYGRLAIAMATVLVVGQVLDLRVGITATVFGSKWMKQSVANSAGIFQFAYLVDAITGFVAFIVVIALAPVLGPSLVGTGGASLVALCAFMLLVSTVDESTFSVMRLLDRYRTLTTYAMRWRSFESHW